MATTKKKKALRRLKLSTYQAQIIRDLRHSLGTAINEAYESMFDLALKHREQRKAWTLKEIYYAMYQADHLIEVVRFIRRILKSMLDGKPDVYLINQLVDEFLGGLDPDEVTPQRVAGARRRAIGLLVGFPKQYKDRLQGAVKGMSIAIVHLGRITTGDLSVEDLVESKYTFMNNYFAALKALRAGWIQMFYTTQADDVRQIKLDETDSWLWHTSMENNQEPPRETMKEFTAISKRDAVVIHLYDDRNEMVWEFRPREKLTEQVYAERVTHVKGRPKFEWGFLKEDVTPGKSFAAQLTTAQKRQVTKMLEERGQMSVAELSRELGVPYHGMAWQTGFQANPNGEVAELAEMHQAIWLMDLSLPE